MIVFLSEKKSMSKAVFFSILRIYGKRMILCSANNFDCLQKAKNSVNLMVYYANQLKANQNKGRDL